MGVSPINQVFKPIRVYACMGIGNSMYSRLDRMVDDGSRTYGRATMRKQMKRDLPTDLIFCDEYSGDVFQLSYNGASQFLRKMQIDNCKENVEWLIEGLLNTPIDDTFLMEGAELSISCRSSYDPQGKSLAEMGIAKSMVCKAPSMPPAQYQRMQRMDGASPALTESQMYMRKIGMPVGDGRGVLFGREVLELSNALRKGTAGDGSYVGRDDTEDIGGMLGKCNVAGSHRLSISKGWQE